MINDIFGPVNVDPANGKEKKNAKERKRERQAFSKAVTSDSRSESGKILFKFYHKLISSP